MLGRYYLKTLRNAEVRVVEKLLKILKEALTINEREVVVEPDTALADLDGWDSLGKLMFISSLYEDCGIVVEPEAVNKALTAGDLWKLVEARKGD
jgi:acyl carrier protein